MPLLIYNYWIYPMLANIFDKKPLWSAGQAFYFQLVPLLLFKNSNTKNQQDEALYRLKIIKGMQVCDQMKKQFRIKIANGEGSFENINLSFTLPNYNPNRNIEFTLILLRSEGENEQEEVGRYVLLSSNFVVQYKDSNTKFYQETASFNEDFSIKFDIYLDNSRFSLEKVIKEMEEVKKVQKPSKSNSKNVNQFKPKFNQTRSQIQSNSQRGGQINQSQGQFMSPTRRIVRKQSESSRKLLRKMDSPTRSQDETSPRRLFKVLSRNSQKEELIAAEKFSNLTQQQTWKLSQKIRQQEEKREKARIQQEKQREAERTKKQVQKQKHDEMAKKKALQLKKMQEKRVAEEQRKQGLRIVEQQRLEQKMLQQKRAEQRKQAERKNQQVRQQRQLRRAETLKKRQEQANQRKQKETLGKAEVISQQTKSLKQNNLSGNKNSSTKINVGEKVKKPMTVRVKTENEEPVVNFVYDAKTPSSKDSSLWKKNIEFKKTGSQIFDKNGNPIKEQRQSLDGPSGIKKKVGIGLILLLLFLGLAYFMNPSVATKKKKKRK